MKLPSLRRQLLGKRGEELAASLLINKGYRLIEKNFRKRYGEIDLVARWQNTLVFVEVKTRIGRRFGTPEESVTARKLRQVVKTAEYYKMTHAGLPDSLRIDVVAIELDDNLRVMSMRHIENITL